MSEFKQSVNLQGVRERRAKWGRISLALIIVPCAFFFMLKMIGIAYAPFRVGGKNVEVQNRYAVRVSEKIENSNDYVFNVGNEQLCNRHYPLGAPTFKDRSAAPFSALLCYDEFALHWSSEYKTPLWGSYVLTTADWETGIPQYTATKWLPDVNIEQVSPKNVVAATTVQQANMVAMPLVSPLDFAYSEDATKQASYTTNLVAVHPNSSQAWLTLNKAIHGLIGKKNPHENDILERLLVVSGATYKPMQGKYAPTDPKQPKFYQFGNAGNEIGAPNYLYKAVLHPRTGRAIAFLIPNYQTEKPINLKDEKVVMTIQDLEQQTGVKFFDSAQGKVPYKRNTELLSWF